MSAAYTGKVVVVFGGAGGIGQAVLARFGQAGASLVLVDLHQDAVDTARKKLEDAGHTAMGLCCDITDATACQQTVDKILAAWGGIDVVVHSAGLTQISACIHTEMDTYRRVMEVNFFGPVQCTKAALPHLIKRKGMIVALSSIAGIAPLVARTGYCASKYALHGFFDTLRVELADKGVGVLLVCPTFTQTDFARKGLRGSGAPIDFDRSTTGKALTPEQVASAIFNGVVQRKRLLVLSTTGKLSYWLARLIPPLYDRMMHNRFKEELHRK